MDGPSCSRSYTYVKRATNQNIKRTIRNSSGRNLGKRARREQPIVNAPRNEPRRVLTTMNSRQASRAASVSGAEPAVPQYFENVFLLLDEHVKNRHTQWVRAFVACGGTLVPDYHRGRATHVLHLYDEEPLERMYRLHNVVHIIVEWIKDTIRDGALKDDKPYRVRLKGRVMENNGNDRRQENTGSTRTV